MKTNPWETIDALADDLGIKSEARRKWRERGQVPYRWRIPLLKLAVETGKPLAAEDFDPPKRGRAA